VSLETLVLGGINGLVYAILAVALILVWGSNRFVNFAQGNLGSVAAMLLAKLVIDFHVAYWLAVPTVLVGAAAVGGLIELTIVRRLFDASRLVLVVATIALSQLFLYLSLQRSLRPDRRALVERGFPLPFHAHVQVGHLSLNGEHLAVIALVPLLALALTAFLRLSAYGQAIRAAAENPDAARLCGISVRRMSTLVWVIAGVLAAVTGMLIAPLRATFAVESMGPSILVRALAAALIARMASLPVAFAAAMAIGIGEAFVFATWRDGGLTDLFVFGAILLALLVRGRQLTRTLRDTRGAGEFGTETPPLAERVSKARNVVVLRSFGMSGALVAALVIPLLPVLNLNSSRTGYLLAITCGYAMVGVALTIVTGWGGQVSLGHFALVGVGAFTVARFESLPVPIVVLLAGTIAAVAAGLIGLPALRLQGLFLAVTTLAFAVVASGWAFQERAFVRTQFVFLTRPRLLRTEHALYYFALLLLLASLWIARNLRRTGPGRLLIGVRDNDAAARSAGISAMGTRLMSFVLSGFIAGVAGALFAFARQNLNATDFPPTQSLTVLLMVVVGGLGSLTGAMLGALFMFGIPALLGSSDAVRLVTSSLGVLVVLLYLPGGLTTVYVTARDALALRVARHELGLTVPPRSRPTLRELWRVARGETFVAAPAVERGAEP
jgi:ABC-type branched-subunit amino acid transport system permease subunit